MSEYLAKFIARAGGAARRKAAELVKAGEVKVNGEVEFSPARLVTAGVDVVELAGRKLVPPARRVYIKLHKPRGYTTSHADAHAEHLAIELIDYPEAGRLVSAGRLDRDSEGLLIFSNDGDFIQRLAHPRFEVHKLYEVIASRVLDEAAMARMQSGIEDDGETLRAIRVEPVPDAINTYRIELAEGKKREIRRMLAACGAETLRLKRLAMGGVELGDLPAGEWRHLTEEELKKLSQYAKIPEKKGLNHAQDVDDESCDGKHGSPRNRASRRRMRHGGR